WQDLKDYFKKAGRVLHADVMEEAGGRSRGFGLVEFSTAEEAQQAIAMLHDSELDGRRIFVREDRENESGSISSIAKRGNIPPPLAPIPIPGPSPASVPGGPDGFYGAPGYGFAYGGASAYGGGDAYGGASTYGGANTYGGSNAYAGSNSYAGSNAYAGSNGAPGMLPPPVMPPPIYSQQMPPSSSYAPAANNEGTTLFVGNLPYGVNWQELKDHFREAGDVEHVEIPQLSDGKSRGYGIVRFVHPDDAMHAIDRFNGTELKGRTIIVRHDRGK
ncbi:hypothetical protein PINS_up023166, partial [Pythium insidiosum]